MLDDLVNLWINTYYPDKVILVLYNCHEAFDSIPVLNILKRDNLKVYNIGMLSDFAFIKYETPEKACDFVYNFEYRRNLKWTIYNKGQIHTRSK
jgi:hypothetical protein